MEHRLNKFNAYVLEGNTASATMMEKLGCVREGVRRQVAYIDGEFMDFILYGMTKDEFVAAQKEQ
ncbi:GNAT family N-acetyltransferase [Saccharibacillus sp. O23]|uniref:GNAT family N-acetyltransferase n=1 Tax=Saccharibacillus sp. O23 TaxID=2009338 RepID=UPI000B4E11D5|nr:GNAT family protein [Saccharibacillus sp. O23]